MGKSLYLIRGIPGSGKSTLASEISEISFEADQYFIKNGEYTFDPSKLKDAHQWCQLQVDAAMACGEEKISVSNTFTQEWEMEAYFKLAEKYGYRVFSLIIENRHGNKNLHGVPSDALQRMRDRFQISL
jgi:predicted kinase